MKLRLPLLLLLLAPSWGCETAHRVRVEFSIRPPPVVAEFLPALTFALDIEQAVVPYEISTGLGDPM